MTKNGKKNKIEIFNCHFDAKICPKVLTASMVGLQYRTSFLIKMVIIYLLSRFLIILCHLLDLKSFLTDFDFFFFLTGILSLSPSV